MTPFARALRMLRSFNALLIAVLLGLVLLLQQMGFPNALDLVLLDRAMRWVAPPPHPDIALVTIDSKSLQALGRWPWSRALLASAVERMRRVGTRVVAIDIALIEPNAQDPAGDRQLIDAVTRHGKVVLPVYPQRARAQLALDEALPFEPLRGVARLGHVDVEIERDGASRSIYLLGGVGRALHPALSLAALEADRGSHRSLYGGERRPLSQATSEHAWTRDYAKFVPFVGKTGAFSQYSFVDVLRQDAVLANLTGKYVILGVTAEGLRTTFLTPGAMGASLISGVEYHANVMSALIQGRLIAPVSFPVHLLMALLAVFAPTLLYAPSGLSRSAWRWAGLSAAVLLIWFVSLRLGWWFAPSAALLVLAVGYGLWLWRTFLTTSHSLQHERKRARAALVSVGDGVITADEEWRICYANPAGLTLLGQPMHALKGKSLKHVLQFESLRDERRFEDVLFYCAHAKETVRPVEAFVLSMGGKARCALRVCVSPIKSNEAGEEHYVLALSDVTQSMEMTQKVAHQATHDALTDLPNRVLLTDRIDQSIVAALRTGEALAVLFLDLDGFKRVNDSFGHSVGDELIKEVARRLSTRRRLSDTVSRWGGDEFVILMRGLRQGESVAGAVGDVQSSFHQPFRMHDEDVHISASLGIALYPQDGADAETLLKHADMAMYHAKREGRNQLRFYSQHDDQTGHRHLETESQLHRALRNHELVVFYQPQVSLRTGSVVGVEALVRWQHPERGLVLPGQFMSVAEESDLVGSIGEHVMRVAFAQARAWEGGEVGFRTMSVNLSPRQFMSPDLIAALDRIVEETGVSPRQLKVEVTETLMVDDSAPVRDRFEAIKKRGMRLVLDDFGTGFSSLSYLKRYAPDELKIDKTFIRDITQRPQDAAITESLITLAHRMNMTVVAEGVETQEQLDLLRRQNCDQVQGFFLSPSVAADALPGVIDAIGARLANFGSSRS